MSRWGSQISFPEQKLYFVVDLIKTVRSNKMFLTLEHGYLKYKEKVPGRTEVTAKSEVRSQKSICHKLYAQHGTLRLHGHYWQVFYCTLFKTYLKYFRFNVSEELCLMFMCHVPLRRISNAERRRTLGHNYIWKTLQNVTMRLFSAFTANHHQAF